ncbi:hypothetical protein [Pseudovibrio exalbescens]|uniref:hypothetical protein n=1 Tax=Pseudovibrio exalbescens TaxID=197461 RepID=UPI000C99F1C6|nr:hypothetical protein [Pseudovibrio exalbescens]
MKHLLCCLFVFCAVPAAADGVATPEDLRLHPAEIHAEDGTIYYRGIITETIWDRFLQVAEAAETPRQLVVTSGGGDATTSRKIGRWVHDHGLDVKVVGGCFSSCANSVFPAGKRKIIAKDAFVGWHGSEAVYADAADDDELLEILLRDTAREEFKKGAPDLVLTPELAAQADARAAKLLGDIRAAADGGDIALQDILRGTIRDPFLAANPELAGTPDLKQLVAEGANIIEAIIKDEKAFSANLGLTGDFANFGLRPDHFNAYEASGKKGWTFTLEDMRRLGLKQVLYEGDGSYASSKGVQRYLTVLSLD